MSDELSIRLAEANAQIQLAEAKLNEVRVGLLAAASVILELLRQEVRATKDTATVLSRINTPWAKSCTQRLRAAIRKAEVKRPDSTDETKRQEREAKILLSLPKNTEAAIRDWLQEIRQVDENSDWLVAATRYGSERLRTFLSAVRDIANELSAIDDPEAHACAKQLGKLSHSAAPSM